MPFLTRQPIFTFSKLFVFVKPIDICSKNQENTCPKIVTSKALLCFTGFTFTLFTILVQSLANWPKFLFAGE